MEHQTEHTTSELAEALARLEQTNRQLAKSARTHTILIVLLLLALAASILLLALPAGQAASEMRQEVHAAMQVVQSLDVERLNNVIANVEQAAADLGQVDLQSLNESIRSLRDIITPIANLFHPGT